MRRFLIGLATLLAALLLAGVATAAPSEPTIDRGVVQSISPGRIVLRELDGSTITITIGARTRVLLNGLPATVADIRPGFVAAVAHDGTEPARVIRAFGRIQTTIDRGIVVSVSCSAFVIRTLDGTTHTFHVTARTRVRWRGLRGSVAAIRPGRCVEVAHTLGGEAVRVVVRGRRAV